MFAPEEDNELRLVVEAFSDNEWAAMNHNMPRRKARQCRECWLH
jgi:hypothetical protein